MSEFGEPWEAATLGKVGVVVGPKYVEFYGDQEFSPQTANRIVSCVNARAGVPTEDIEQIVQYGKEYFQR
jgi:hypothetical protein